MKNKETDERNSTRSKRQSNTEDFNLNVLPKSPTSKSLKKDRNKESSMIKVKGKRGSNNLKSAMKKDFNCEKLIKAMIDYEFFLEKYKEIELHKLVLFKESDFERLDHLMKNIMSSHMLLNNISSIIDSKCDPNEENQFVSNRLKKIAQVLA
jgi:hypothetical protein